MKYRVVILALFCLLIPQFSSAQIYMPWFTNTTINGATKGTKPATGALPEVSSGSYGIGVSLDSAMGITTTAVAQAHGMIGFWLKPLWNGNDGQTHRILKIGDPTKNGILVEKSSENMLRFVMAGTNKVTVARTDVSNWAINKWHHIVITWMDQNSKPLGIALWVDKVAVDSRVFGGDSFMNPSTMTDKQVYIGNGEAGTSSNAIMDELIIRKELSTTDDPGQINIVYRDYFRTAPYTSIKIDPDPNIVHSEPRVVLGAKKQLGLYGQLDNKWVRITDFANRYANWGEFDAKPFISWSSSNTAIATVGNSTTATKGLVSGVAAGNCTITASFRGLTATYGIKVITWDQADLDLMYVERTPRYLKNASKKWPDEGEAVQSIAHIGNFGYRDVPAGTAVRFELIPDTNNNFKIDPDEELLKTTQTAYTSEVLSPGSTTTITFNWTWTQSPTYVRVTLDPSNAVSEFCEVNNQRCELNIARAFHWGYNTQWFSDDYTKKHVNLVGSFSDYDWCNAETDRMELVMRDAVYDTTSPYGIRDSIRVDKYTVKEYGNWNDEPWVKEGDYFDGGFSDMEPQNGTIMQIDAAIGHEIGHTTIWLPDIYGFPHRTYNVFLRDENGKLYGGTKLYPEVKAGTDPGMAPLTSAFYDHPDSLGVGYSPLMVDCHLWLDANSAGLSDRCSQQRSGITDKSPGWLIPQDNQLRVYDANDEPLKGAAVYVYQIVNTSIWDANPKYLPDRPKYIGNTDDEGKYLFPKYTDATWDDQESDVVDGSIYQWNPWRHVYTEAWSSSWTNGECLVLKIVSGNQTEFQWLPLSEANNEYLRGNTALGNYPIRTSLTSTGVTPTVTPTYPDAIKNYNYKPVAVAPKEVEVTVGSQLVIDGTKSYDPEGQPLIYRWLGWEFSDDPVLNVTAPGSTGDYEYTFYVLDGERISDTVKIIVHVIKNSKLSGQVLDSNGQPVPGAVVGVKKTPFASADADLYITADANGNYGPKYVEPGAYYVAAWKQGWSVTPDKQITVYDNTPLTQNFQFTKLEGQNLILSSQNVRVSDPDPNTVPYPITDGNINSGWYSSWSPSGPVYVYVDLFRPTDISGITLYSDYYNYSWGTLKDDFTIDVMTDGEPLTPTSWDNNSNVHTVYSALQTLHGYQISSSIAADPIKLQMNGVRGIRIKYEHYNYPYYYTLRELVIHSASDFTSMMYGWVKDEQNQPIRNAAVQLGGFGSSNSVITDNSGFWTFSPKSGIQELYCDAQGYDGIDQAINVTADGTPIVKTVTLKKNSEVGQYNGDFSIPSPTDSTKPDGWELYIDDGGKNPQLFSLGRDLGTANPDGNPCAIVRTGTPNQAYPYWTGGWIRPTAEHRIKVDPNKTYNFYFKAKRKSDDYSTVGSWKLVWLDAKGNQVDYMNQYDYWWDPGADWGQIKDGYGPFTSWMLKPMIQVRPPATAVWAEVQIGLSANPVYDNNRRNLIYIDDLVFDEFSNVLPKNNRLSDIRNLNDGEIVKLTQKNLTVWGGSPNPLAGSEVPIGIPPGVGYIEEKDRSFGIMLDVSNMEFYSANGGDMVNLTGIVETSADGEKYILVTMLTSSWNGGSVKPLMMNNGDLGGATEGNQAGYWNWRWTKNASGTYDKSFLENGGPNTTGLLVKMYGKITQIDPSGQYFYIDDGSHVEDGTQTGGEANIGIRVALDGNVFTKGRFVTIIGVSSCFKHTDGKLRNMLKAISIR